MFESKVKTNSVVDRRRKVDGKEGMIDSEIGKSGN